MNKNKHTELYGDGASRISKGDEGFEGVPVLDSMVICFTGMGRRVKYLGDRSEVETHLKRHFPDVQKYEIVREAVFYRAHQYPLLLGIIDIDKKYRFIRAI